MRAAMYGRDGDADEAEGRRRAAMYGRDGETWGFMNGGDN